MRRIKPLQFFSNVDTDIFEHSHHMYPTEQSRDFRKEPSSLTHHITSALGRQVDRGRCFQNNPPFLLQVFEFSSSEMGAENKKKDTNNKIPASAKYQTWPLKQRRGAGLCRMFHSEVVVVAVGDAGWSQEHIRLVSGGRWGCCTLPPLDLPLSLLQPQAVKPHNFPLTALVMLSCWLDVTGWEVLFLFSLKNSPFSMQESKSYYNNWLSQLWYDFMGIIITQRPKQMLESPCNLPYNSIIFPPASLKVTHLILLVTTPVVLWCSDFLHHAKHYSPFMPVGHPVDIKRECILSSNPQQMNPVGKVIQRK